MIRLCRADRVREGTPVRAVVDGLRPLAVYRVGSRLFVTDDTCTHSKASLSEGEQEGSTIICPIHGGAFDIETGAAKTFPCTHPLEVYAAVEQEGWICIEERV